MSMKKLVVTTLALMMVSVGGVTFAASGTTTKAPTATSAEKAAHKKLVAECKKEVGADKAKIKSCVETKSAGAAKAK